VPLPKRLNSEENGLAEREGFEPRRAFDPYTLSRVIRQFCSVTQELHNYLILLYLSSHGNAALPSEW